MSDIGDCRPEVVDALLALVGTGLLQNHDIDAMAVLEAARLWRADSVEVGINDAWLALKRGDCAEATRILLSFSEKGAGEKTQSCRALLSVCLAAMNDPAWEGLAQSVIDDGSDACAVAMIRSLRGEEISTADASSTAATDATRGASPAENEKAASRGCYLRA